jgi:signal transduction histidine kinase/CheY-like chemotaxis protein
MTSGYEQKKTAGCMHRQRRRRSVFFLVLLCAVFSAFTIPVRAENSGGSRKQVLFINSYGYDFETVPVVMKEVSERLGSTASIQYLFMNEKYIGDEEAEKHLSEELDALTSEFRYSAVILGDDAAFDFAVQNRDRYFRNIPLIYEDINSIEKAEKYKNDPLISGVVEAFPMKGTIALAHSVQKNAGRVVVITDNSVSGAGSAAQAMAEQTDFPDLKFELFDTSRMTADEIKEKISAYGNDTILLYTVFNVDGEGRRYMLSEGVRLITEAADIPVFKADEAGLGEGLLGGYVLSYQSIGRETADLVLAALNGTGPDRVNYRAGSCIYKFDQKVMDRFKISKSTLPAGSVFINASPGFFEANEKPIIILTCASAVLFALTLLFSESKKRKLLRDLELEEKSNRAKTEFISKMSHDIRTPLNAVLGMNRLAMDHAAEPERVREYLGKAVYSGKLLNSLVNDILDVSKIENGKMKLNPSPYSLADFFENVKSVFENLCAEKEIRLTIRENAGKTTVLTDPVRFNQLFYNLLTNAVKFTEKGGTIAFRLDSSLENGSLSCVFTVADTGCGMSPDFQKHMFDQFAQEGKKNVQGSGLGLAIAKSITDLMGGRIEVTSEPEKGSTFSVYLDLPVAGDSAVGNMQPGAGTDLSKLRGKRVLLAEDNEINAQIAELMLQDAGVMTDVAGDGNEAVRMFAEAPAGYYFLILMDNRMPGRTGTEAAEAIRRLSVPGADSIPIIALTADAFEDDYRKFIDSGMNDCLTKPLERDRLIAVMLRYC